jgi:hypothetical protein
VKLRSHSSNDATTDEEGSGKERSGDLHLPETDTERRILTTWVM